MPFSVAKEYDYSTTTWNEVPTVYGILNAKKQMIYIGQTDDMKRRMAEHEADTKHCMHAYGPSYVWAEVITDRATRLARETELIAEYGPPCNK